jgi:hypothetical protein
MITVDHVVTPLAPTHHAKFGQPEIDGVHMHDEQYGSTELIDVTTISLGTLKEMDHAALRSALTSCLSDEKEHIASFGNTI